MSLQPRSSTKMMSNDMHEEEYGKMKQRKVSGKRLVGESIVVFIVSIVVLYALSYFFIPQYVISIEGKTNIYIGRVSSGILVLSIIITAIFAYMRSTKSY